MSRWFRFYDEALNDPKILKLSDSLHRIWVGILCVASKNDGRLPPLDDLCLMIRIKPEKMQAALESLIKSGLIDDDGSILSPHNWNGRQYKSDVSTDRVKRFRNGKRNVTVTPPETEQIQSRTDTLPSVALRVVVSPTPKKRSVPLPSDWKPSLKAYEIAEQFGQNVQIVEGIFRDYLASSGKLYADHDAAFHNFIRNQNSFNRGGGANGVRQTENRGSIINAADRAIAHLEREITADNEAGEGVVLSLPSQRL